MNGDIYHDCHRCRFVYNYRWRDEHWLLTKVVVQRMQCPDWDSLVTVYLPQNWVVV